MPVSESTLATARKRAIDDHRGSTEYPPIAPLLVSATVVRVNPASDTAFDRCSFARWERETFTYDGRAWRIADYFGRSGSAWRCIPIDDEKASPVAILSESALASVLTSQNGPHPDPYIASVELTYDVAGHRALYGIRASGSLVLWQD